MQRLGPVLAIDTSTEMAGVAIVGTADEIVELRWHAGREQTTSVLEQIDRCLALIGRDVSTLSGVVIASGPGSFNGLRVGMSMAKGFAYSLAIPIVAVSTLELTATPWFGLDREVIAVVAAGRERLAWAEYAADGSLLQSPRNTTLAELETRVAEVSGCLLVGEVPAGDFSDCIVRRGGVGMRSATMLAQIGIARIATGMIDDLTLIEPGYLHGNVAAATA